jgi:putative copper export protein
MALWSYTGARVTNDVLHDLAAGAWPGAVAALWIVRSGSTSALRPEALALALKSWSGLFAVLVVALAVLIATGAGRLSYRGLGVRPAVLASRARTALIKHGVFVTVLVAATVWAFMLLKP